MEQAISVQGLIKQYGSVVALDGITFDIPPGELVGFLGNNGAGKTTTMRILTTWQPATAGTARVAGYDVMYQSDEVRRRLGYLPESVPLYPDLRVEEYLEYRAKLKAVERGIRARRIGECLERCRIREVRRRLIASLSKGYRQRVGLADTLLADPPVLILDEPLSGLDPIQQEETLASIRELGGKHTVLFSSHHLPDVEKVCDRVIIINRGTIRFDGRLSEIREREPTVVIEARGSEKALRGVLTAVPHVATIKMLPSDEPGFAAAEIKAEPGHDVREHAASALFTAGYPVRRIETRREKLEDIFLRTAVRGESA